MTRLIRTRVRRGEQGFTLIELLIVVNILGILALTAIPSYLSLKGRAEDNANKANVRSIVNSINAFYQDNSTYSGMTLAALQTYNAAIETSKYTLNAVTSTAYCIQSPQGSTAHVWRKNGPAAVYDKNHC